MNSTPLISYENSLREIVAVEEGVKWFVAIINYYLYESVKTYNIAFFLKKSSEKLSLFYFSSWRCRGYRVTWLQNGYARPQIEKGK